MTTPEHHDGMLAPWQPDRPPAAAAPPAWDDAPEPGAGAEPGRKFSARVVMRACRRHWWQILLIWAVASGGLMTWAYLRVKPTYDAIAYVQIDPPNTAILPGTISTGTTTVESQLETQAQRMTTPDVLGLAVKDPKVAALPRIQAALDAEAAIRKEVRVQIVPKTRYITIAMTSTSSDEAATIVNAVALAYEMSVSNLAAADTRKQTKRLEKFLDDLNKQVDEKQAVLKELVERADRFIGFSKDDNQEARNDLTADQRLREQDRMSVEEFKSVAAQINTIELNLMEEEKRLDRLKTERRRSLAAVKLDRAVEQELQSSPEVVRLAEDYEKATKQMERAQQLVGRTDISYREARRRAADLKAKYEATAQRLKPAIRRRLEREVDHGGEREVRDVEDRIASLQVRRDGLQKKLKEMKVEGQRAAHILQKDSLEIELARQELSYTRNMREQIHRQLTAMLYDAEANLNKVHLTLAGISHQPTTNNRVKLMAAAPVGTLAVVLALFVLLEVGAGRVNDPDDLPGRLHLGVIGVVPPLPPAEPSKGALPWGNGQDRARRRVEEFVQSLDHLRVQLWAGRGAGSKHRCVLITSACVSEGKTTLAAQLAGRCANSGLSTLLIDADLRRPALARLLEVPGEPGLADVLAGDLEPEAALVVIGSAGGFHLLPAGGRGHDPSRLLQGEQLGALLARFRETFDIIIVDAPPVLPVPDALILGRWTDGAVLAVRHDSSRYPMVERAQHKLASVGVPILGAVVNGVRGGGSAYGNYAYSSAQGDRDGAL